MQLQTFRISMQYARPLKLQLTAMCNAIHCIKRSYTIHTIQKISSCFHHRKLVNYIVKICLPRNLVFNGQKNLNNSRNWLMVDHGLSVSFWRNFFHTIPLNLLGCQSPPMAPQYREGDPPPLPFFTGTRTLLLS